MSGACRLWVRSVPGVQAFVWQLRLAAGGFSRLGTCSGGPTASAFSGLGTCSGGSTARPVVETGPWSRSMVFWCPEPRFSSPKPRFFNPEHCNFCLFLSGRLQFLSFCSPKPRFFRSGTSFFPVFGVSGIHFFPVPSCSGAFFHPFWRVESRCLQSLFYRVALFPFPTPLL